MERRLNLRPLIAAFALLSPSALMAQADQDAIIVTGVVDGVGGGGGSQAQGETTWTSSFGLVVWRESGPQGDGTMRAEPLRIEIPDQREGQLDRWKSVFPPRTLVRFAIRAPVREVNGRAFAELRAPLPRPQDAELLAAAAPILNPPPILDPAFGRFTSDPTFPQAFKQPREWLGREIEVTLTLDYAGPPGPDAPEQALATMRGVWDKREAWDARIREAIAEEYYDVWVDNWRDENEPLIDREAFKARFVLSDASFTPEGDFSFTFGDDDLFWGHAMMVDYFAESDTLYVAMFG